MRWNCGNSRKNVGTCENWGLKKRGKSDSPITLFSLGYYLNVKSNFLLLSMKNKHTHRKCSEYLQFKIWPDELAVALHGWLCYRCVNVCIKRCKSLWIKASAKCPIVNWNIEVLILLFLRPYNMAQTYKTLSTTSVALQTESAKKWINKI